MMFSSKLSCVVVFVIVASYPAVSTSVIVKRDAPCPNRQFTGAPKTTMYPTEGKRLVNAGRTLKGEAAEKQFLSQVIQNAENNSDFTTRVAPYGRAMGLDYNESLTIFCFTMDNSNFYRAFNNAMKQGNDAYPIYHYFLDSGIKKLARKQGNKERVGYRGTRYFYSFSKTMSTFPSFTEASLVRTEAEAYWSQGCTMFNITTRQGAYVKKMSSSAIELLLIPPYEMFKIGGYKMDGGKKFQSMSSQALVSSAFSGICSSQAIMSFVVIGHLLTKIPAM